MFRYIPYYIKLPIIIGIVTSFALAYSQQRGFRELMVDYINDNRLEENVEITTGEGESYGTIETDPDKFIYEPFTYKKGDWAEHVIVPEYSVEDDKKLHLYKDDDIKITSYGSMKLNLVYGKSVFTSDKYRHSDDDEPVSREIKQGFVPQQELLLHMEGTIGKRMTVYIDHDSRKEDNTYIINYKAINEDEVIQEINAGEIDIDFNESKYAVYDNTTAKGLGVDVTLKKGDFKIKAFGSVLKGETEVELFRGNSSPGNMRLSEYQFIKKTYYQIEPYIRYTNPLVHPDTLAIPNYALQPVNISATSFALYMDDQNSLNNYNAIQLPLDGGYYTKLQNGVDYSINYATGLIRFIRAIPENARIFAVYNLASGASTDPGVLPPGDPNHPGGDFTGKNFVFIRYDYSIEEQVGDDRNNDGKVNQDIYEVRSFYYLGDKNLLSNNFNLQFYEENRVLETNDADTLGRYKIDYSEGIVQFIYREPFKILLNTTADSQIYTEKQSDRVFEYSRYRLNIDYYKEARSFQLKHMNIIQNSVSVKINDRKLSTSLYSVDHTSGFLRFTNPNNPIISPETLIEIKYEYLPFGGQTNAFVGGFRADYAFNRNLKAGGSLLYSRSSSDETIPNVDNAPTQTVVVEGDASLFVGQDNFADLLNIFTDKKRKKVPLEFNAYGEYAASFKDINTFGKGLIDNMESSDETIILSLSEKDWILSSKPPAVPALSTRGRLNYYYFRDPSSGTVQDLTYGAPLISYAVKSGPFNVNTGHLPDSVQDLISLVLDFNGTGDFASITTRNLATSAVDCSGLQYIEISYRYEGTTDITLNLDLGAINEDSDNDGILDTEDVNRNNILDIDAESGYSEDIGYSFNDPVGDPTRVGSGASTTGDNIGDGVLNTEDLNNNGTLDQTEDVYTLPAITLNAASTGWQTQRIYIDTSSLTDDEIATLKEVRNVRMYLTGLSGLTGRLYIDGINMVSSKWRNVEMDSNPAGPGNLEVTVVDTWNDAAYRAEAFIYQNRVLYESLYGSKDDRELESEKESALQLVYDVSGGNTVSVTRRFLKSMDLRFYKTLNLWFNYRNTGDTVGVIIGSSDNDYIEYQFPMDVSNIWREVRLRLRADSSGDYSASNIVGNPDLKRIKFMKILVTAPGNAGSLWVNDIYVSEPEKQKGDAHWFESQLKVTEPIFYTDGGTPVLSDLQIKYIKKGHGAQFNTVGKTWEDISEDYHEISSSVDILPNWTASVDYTLENTSTDSLNENVIETKRGDTIRNSLFIVSDYSSKTNGVPSVKIAYKFDSYDNDLEETIDTYSVNKKSLNSIHTPTIYLTEKVDKIFGGKLLATVVMDMFFKESEIERSSDMVSEAVLGTLTSRRETEKRQRADTKVNVNFANDLLYIKPSFQVSSEEIVAYSGKGETNEAGIVSDFKSDFHFPFIYGDDAKFVERNKRLKFVCGVQNKHLIAPSYIVDLQYFENRFNDYNITELVDTNFSRSKSARSYVSTKINVPLSLHKIKALNFIKVFNFSYRRDLNFNENDIPFEGDSHGAFEEKYGIKRPFGRIANSGMNIFQYYPFYFFLGRDNYARGRDYIYHSLNEQIYFSNGTVVSNYDNQLRLLDNFAFNTTLDFQAVDIDSRVGVNQIVDRQNVQGVPKQIITFTSNININLDLMKIFNFWFFRTNEIGLPHHSSTLTLGYDFANNQHITSNIEEFTHTPNFGLMFRRNRSSLSFRFGLGIRKKNNREFISADPTERSWEDNIYFENMPENAEFLNLDYSYTFAVIFETDIIWLYNFFNSFYPLVSSPIFNVEYSMKINRYDYLNSVSPEPYDMYMIKMKLILDLHRNVQGSMMSRFVLEQFRNRDTENISQEVFSYELSFNFSLVF